MDLFQQDCNSTPRIRVSVCVPLLVDRCFTYLAPASWQLRVGDYVSVPFHGSTTIGVVWDGSVDMEYPESKMKQVQVHHRHMPPMPKELRHTIERAASYNVASLGMVLKLAMPVPQAITHPAQEIVYACAPIMPELRRTDKREVLLNILKNGAHTKADIEDAGVSAAILSSMVKLGAVRKQSRSLSFAPPVLAPTARMLSDEQREVADVMVRATDNSGFQPFLLDGATGSGKTEVFFEAAEAVMAQGGQVLLMLPEIALSMQICERAEKRFGIKPVLWHSSQTPARRLACLQHIMHGGAPLVIGARSALLLPYRQLGLIIVDEAHDGSYKQMDQVIYHARDMAVLRAKMAAIPVILSSATPSLETLWNAQQGRYHHVHLTRRADQAALPKVDIISMKQEKMPAKRWISPSLTAKMHAVIDGGKQVLLFINRRGYAPLLLCQTCGHRYGCPACSAWMVHHAHRHSLLCHHCGLNIPEPDACAQCGSVDGLVDCGAGVERIDEEVRAAFPEARIALMSGDHMSAAVQVREALQSIARGEVDIIIGTQLLAKGHHFPHLALVGVLDADAGLSGGDIRANEKTYQLLHQLAGRAGREADRGEVLLQSYQPDHPLMQALTSWDRDGFVSHEMEERANAHMPPFGRLASLIIEGREEQVARHVAESYAKCMPHIDRVVILGPAPAPLYKLRNIYRYRFLVIAPKDVSVQVVMRDWRACVALPSQAVAKIDIDPISFL